MIEIPCIAANKDIYLGIPQPMFELRELPSKSKDEIRSLQIKMMHLLDTVVVMVDSIEK